MKNLLFFTSIISVLFLASCSSDDAETIIVNNVETPQNYSFQRNGQSSVDFNGQTTRILMADETVAAFNDFDNTTLQSLQAMFDHQVGNNDFSDAALNASDKSVRSKTAASQDYFATNITESVEIKNTFDGFIFKQINEVYPNRMTNAAPGIPGQIADGTRTRYVNANGLEYNQAFAKSLIGALMADQMLNNYLSVAVLDEGNNRANNDADITETDKPYTTMEHKWDEAYGYLFGTAADPVNPIATIGSDDSFLNEYVGQVNNDPDFSTIATTIYDAFKLGRAAIVFKNYEVRDAQAKIIQQKISEVIAIRGIYYLQQGKNAIAGGNQTGSFHALSEAYGFIYALRFTRNPETNTTYFTKAEVESLLNDLTTNTGFWNITPSTLDIISEAIASKFSFTVSQAASL